MIWADILAEQTQLRIAISLFHIPEEGVVGLVFLDDVDDVLENAWFTDPLGYGDRCDTTWRQRRCSPKVPTVISRDMTSVAV